MTNPISPDDFEEIRGTIADSFVTKQLCSVAIECDLRDHKVAIGALDQVLAAYTSADGAVTDGGLDVWSEAVTPSGEWRILIRQA